MGNSPTFLSMEQMRKVVPLWQDLSVQIFKNPVSNKVGRWGVLVGVAVSSPTSLAASASPVRLRPRPALLLQAAAHTAAASLTGCLSSMAM